MSDRPTVIVTGGSAGIGLAIVERFADLDYRVLSLARRRCPIDTVESVLVDLGNPAAVQAAIAEVEQRLPDSTLLHLVHNAAAMPTDTAREFDPRVLERTLRLNVTTPAEINAALLRRMSPGSSITFIASTLSEKGVASRLSYVTSKHAVLGLMRATVQDLFGSQVHCLCVAPGFTDTAMLAPGLANPTFSQAVRDMVSFGRLLEPEEIADIVVFATRTPALNGSIVHANLGQRER